MKVEALESTQRTWSARVSDETGIGFQVKHLREFVKAADLAELGNDQRVEITAIRGENNLIRVDIRAQRESYETQEIPGEKEA